MQGELHILMGVALGWPCLDDPWKLAIAIPAAMMTHWILDDMNKGKEGCYHGLGTGWRRIVYNFSRLPIFAGIGWLLWQHPLLAAPALLAWLCLDHEWVLNPWRHGYGLHERMWFKWLQTEWALIPRFALAAGIAALFAI